MVARGVRFLAPGAGPRELSLEARRPLASSPPRGGGGRRGKIVLWGGCARLSGLDEFLSSSWGIPVELARPFAGIQVDAGRFPGEEMERIGPSLAVAVGLGLRRPGDKPS